MGSDDTATEGELRVTARDRASAPRSPLPSTAGNPRRGLSLVAALSLVAVVSVLVAVSLPRLRSFARNENEADARRVVRLLAAELSLLEAQGDPPPVQDLCVRDEVRRALTDSDFLSDGRLLRRHGYLFAVLNLPPDMFTESVDGEGRSVLRSVFAAEQRSPGAPSSAGDSPGRWAVVAWPWERGRTGHAAFACDGEERLLEHPNDGGSWNGPASLGLSSVGDGSDWHAVR